MEAVSFVIPSGVRSLNNNSSLLFSIATITQLSAFTTLSDLHCNLIFFQATYFFSESLIIATGSSALITVAAVSTFV